MNSKELYAEYKSMTRDDLEISLLAACLERDQLQCTLDYMDKAMDEKKGTTEGFPTWEVEITSCDIFNSPSFRKLNADYFQVYSDGKIIFYNGEQGYGPRVQIAVYAPGQWYGVRKKEWGENEEM